MNWHALGEGLIFLVIGYGILFALFMWLRHVQYRDEIRARLIYEVNREDFKYSGARMVSNVDAWDECYFSRDSESAHEGNSN
jgi:hypothetical protein